MGSVAFAADDESQPSTSNCKLSTMILDGCGAVNHASIPRKLRSAIKKRSRESVTSPLLTSRKQHDVSTTVYRKDGAKKSKLNKKKRHITKDEEEVAETLYALAGMFTNANKADHDEKPEIQSSAALEEADTCRTLLVETRKISSEVTLGAVRPSITDVVNSTEEVVSQTLEARQPVPFFSCKQAATPDAYRGKSDSCPSSTLRPLVSIHGTNQSHEDEIHFDQVTASGLQYGKNKYKDFFPSPNLSAMQAASSETRRLFEGTIFSSQPHVVENKISSEKQTRVATESNNSWKRCSAHVYISRLIKVLQISDRKEGLPTQPTTCRGSNNQMLRINGRNGDTYFSAIDIDAAEKGSSEDQNDFLLHKRPIQDEQMASETSAKQGYGFLSLGMGIRSLDTSESANGAGCFLDPPKQYYMPYMQSRNQSPMLCSLPPWNGYSSSSYYKSASSQAQQLSQYHSSSFTDRTGQYYNTGGGGPHRLPDWRNGAVLNSLFPHLHAALGSKFQQLSPSQQQVIAINASLPLKRHHNLLLGFERNGAVFQPENMHL